MPFPIISPLPLFGPIISAVANTAPDLRDIAVGTVDVFLPQREPVVTVVNEPDPLANYYRIAALSLAATGLAVSIFSLTRK